MKTPRLPLLVAALVTTAVTLPASAQTVGRIRRSLDKATGGQTAAPARPATPPPAGNPQTAAQAAAIQAAQNKRNQQAAVGADQRVIDFLKERVEGGSADAAFDLAKRYEEGKGTVADPKEARRLYELAAERGNEDAKAWLKEHPAPPEEKEKAAKPVEKTAVERQPVAKKPTAKVAK